MLSLHLYSMPSMSSGRGDVADNQKHITPTQREELKAVFRKHRQLFDGTLGVFPTRSVILNLKKALNRYLRGSTQCRIFIVTCSRRNLNSLSSWERSLVSERASGPVRH